jgi:hypothetical protein
MRHTRINAGFGLIETLVATSVAAVLVTMMTRALSDSLELSSTSLTLGGIERSANGTLLSIGRELRWAQPDALVITEENGCQRLDYQIAEAYDGVATEWSTTITLLYEPTIDDGNGNGVLDEGRLVRIQDGKRRTLCRNVAAGSFTAVRTDQRLDLGVTIFGMSRNHRLLTAPAGAAVTLLNQIGS